MISFESLDITLESRGDKIWLLLSGPFNNEEVPSIREKIERLISDGSREFILDLEKITLMDDSVSPMFLSISNKIAGKGGKVTFVFKNPIVHKAFKPFINLLTVYPDLETVRKRGVLHSLSKLRRSLSRKTGFRISKPLALFLLLILGGWFFSLLYIIDLQNQRIHEQERELHELTHWKEKTTVEVEYLQERIRPLEQLGIIREKP
ncbi:hypothetical protein CHISP_2978 [Chitinispirillum alkaliphilum]|nr:hypothetical protein CHISP_2978 [Chitinispirillum alkaliphilum]